MEWIAAVVDFILHIDVHLSYLTAEYGLWIYGILFLIVFAETGLVVTPFLPGDSLLFAAGAIAARGGMDITVMIILLIVAAILGDSVNYSIGRRIGERLFTGRVSRFLNRAHLERAHAFYEKHGGRTIILARFIPIIRTFAPFVAGIGEMTYSKFVTYNVVGAIVWVTSFSVLGYILAGAPGSNFTLITLAIIVISVIPAVIEIIKARRHAKINAETK